MEPTPTQLEQQLAPTHLKSTTEMQAELSKALEAPDPVKALNDDPRAKVEYAFTFRHVDARGTVWEGDFVHTIPTLAQRDLIDLLQARKKANMAVESFSGMAAERHVFVSHLAVCLTKRPDWANNLDALRDPAIVEKLYGRAASHEAYFLGWGPDQGGGEGERGDGGGATP